MWLTKTKWEVFSCRKYGTRLHFGSFSTASVGRAPHPRRSDIFASSISAVKSYQQRIRSQQRSTSQLGKMRQQRNTSLPLQTRCCSAEPAQQSMPKVESHSDLDQAGRTSKDGTVMKVEKEKGTMIPVKNVFSTSSRLLEAMESVGDLDLPPLNNWDSSEGSVITNTPSDTDELQSVAGEQRSSVDSYRSLGANLSSANQRHTEGFMPEKLSRQPSLQTSGRPGSQEEPHKSEQGLKTSSVANQDANQSGRQLDEATPSSSNRSQSAMELQFLGTSSGTPTRHRNVSGLLLRMSRGTWLFDCGEGTQHRLLQAQVSPSSISRLFITHMHGDHVFGLPGLLLSIMDSRAEIGSDREEPLHIYGPKGLGRFIWANLSMTASRLTIPVIVHEISNGPSRTPTQKPSFPSPGRPQIRSIPRVEFPDATFHWDLFDDENLSVKASLLAHRVPCYGYVVEERYERRVDPLRARGWGLEPGPAFASLESGESVRLPIGALVRPDDVLEAPQRRKVCILGDTCDSSNIVAVARNADVLVHEATFENKYEEKALVSTHSTAGMAGAFAREIGAKLLVLTHFSKRYERFESGVGYTEGDSEEGRESVAGLAVRRLVAQAKQTYRSNKVVAAADLKRIQVSRSVYVEDC